jgi:hypothetical protein
MFFFPASASLVKPFYGTEKNTCFTGKAKLLRFSELNQKKRLKDLCRLLYTTILSRNVPRLPNAATRAAHEEMFTFSDLTRSHLVRLRSFSRYDARNYSGREKFSIN